MRYAVFYNSIIVVVVTSIILFVCLIYRFSYLGPFIDGQTLNAPVASVQEGKFSYGDRRRNRITKRVVVVIYDRRCVLYLHKDSRIGDFLAVRVGRQYDNIVPMTLNEFNSNINFNTWIILLMVLVKVIAMWVIRLESKKAPVIKYEFIGRG